MPLLNYRPLEGHELKDFKINTSIESMRAGPMPWIGVKVDFVKGEWKGQYGAVKDVNRYQFDPRKPSKRSGIILTVERFTSAPSNLLVKVDYEAVRFHK